MGVTHITLEPRSARLSQMLSGGLAIIAVSAGISVTTPSPAAPTASTAAVRLLDTAIGVGPSFDGFGATIPLLFYGTAVPSGQTFYTVPYPAMINLGYPVISGLPIVSAIPYWPETLKQSERIGAGYLEQAIGKEPAGEKLTIIGFSQGTQVGEIARADMAKNAGYVANAQDYSFVFIGDPYTPNGGILSRFTTFARVPLLGDLFPLGRPGPSDSPFKTTNYQNQYDGFADFPQYFNPLAITNALLGIAFEHVLPGYVFESPDGPNTVTTTVGNTTYVSIPQYLPLLTPLRLAASLFGAQRFVNALDPILRVFVEMGYNRTADPSQVAEFSWGTPTQKIRQGLQQLPAAIAEGLRILSGASYSPTMPQPVVSTTEPTTPVTNHPAQPVDNSPQAQAVRAAVVRISAAITKLTMPLAKLLQIIGGKASPSPTTAPAIAAPQSAQSAVTTSSPSRATAVAAVPAPAAVPPPPPPAAGKPTAPSVIQRSPESASATTISGKQQRRSAGKKPAPAETPAAHRHDDTSAGREHAQTR
ncbi:PE-PPE domain-containing protein [Mycobacterium sp. CBMA 213]|uniref:PE-PPE domain-containing protein n=1 Tax=Mycolicibacterium sp. CBMA 213 TaxID=1968788 RepID=UPI0012DC13ED|nr:PE-PPE domain-containing protein [Mycolicibacterium sp. CBMA 213]MUM06359.1 PE-PPE domain-containing protein [Mycolicibacterium sp. CBMA 213]